MTTPNNGGPAFPGINPERTGGHMLVTGGMDLRDYFAVHATDNDIAAQIHILRARSDFGILPDNYVVICRYMHADDMLAAREAE